MGFLSYGMEKGAMVPEFIFFDPDDFYSCGSPVFGRDVKEVRYYAYNGKDKAGELHTLLTYDYDGSGRLQSVVERSSSAAKGVYFQSMVDKYVSRHSNSGNYRANTFITLEKEGNNPLFTMVQREGANLSFVKEVKYARDQGGNLLRRELRIGRSPSLVYREVYTVPEGSADSVFSSDGLFNYALTKQMGQRGQWFFFLSPIGRRNPSDGDYQSRNHPTKVESDVVSLVSSYDHGIKLNACGDKVLGYTVGDYWEGFEIFNGAVSNEKKAFPTKMGISYNIALKYDGAGLLKQVSFEKISLKKDLILAIHYDYVKVDSRGDGSILAAFDIYKTVNPYGVFPKEEKIGRMEIVSSENN